MNKTWKRLASAFLSVVMIASLAILPVQAEGAETTLSLDWEKSDTAVTVSISTSAPIPKMGTIGFKITYDATALKFNPGSSAGYITGLTMTANESASGTVAVNWLDLTGAGVDVSSGKIADLVFDADMTKEASMAEFSFVDGKSSVANNDMTEIYDVVNGGSITAEVPGTAPQIASVELTPSSVEVNGTDITVTAAATSTSGNPMPVTLTVEPEGNGVAVANGRIVVDGKAKAGSYTVTATDEGGKTASATLTVTRAESVAASVKIDDSMSDTLVIPASGETATTFKASVLDQFGDPMSGTITWTTSGTLPEGVTVTDAGVATVISAAQPGSFTLTASDGTFTDSMTVKVVNVVVTVKPVEKPTYGMTWKEILPLTGITATQGANAVAVKSAVRYIGDNKDDVSDVLPAAGDYTVTVLASTDAGSAPAVVDVTVAPRAITVKVPNFDSVPHDGKEHSDSKTVKVDEANLVKGELVGNDVVNVTYSAEGTDIGSYEPTVSCDNTNYKVVLEGGWLPIAPKNVHVEIEPKYPDEIMSKDDLLDALKKDDPMKALVDLLGLPTQITVTYSGGSQRVTLNWAIRSHKGDKAILTTPDEIAKYLKDFANNVNGTEAIELVPVMSDEFSYLQPDLKKFEAISLNVSQFSGSNGSGGGSGSGSGAAWRPDNRGGQDIILTPVSVFNDVPDSFWAYGDINWCFYRGIMQGTADKTFSPSRNTNRQQLWMVLGRLSGTNPANMATAREWAVNTGVSDGTNATASLTRQQMVTMLYRWAQSKGYNGELPANLSSFADGAQVSDYARDAMAWAVANGIINGDGTNLNPHATASRAHFAAIMHRFCVKFNVV